MRKKFGFGAQQSALRCCSHICALGEGRGRERERDSERERERECVCVSVRESVMVDVVHTVYLNRSRLE